MCLREDAAKRRAPETGRSRGRDKSMSRGFKAAIGLIAILVMAVLITPVITVTVDGHGYARNRTQAILQSVAAASRAYNAEYGHWPATTADLTNNGRRIIFIEWLPSQEWKDGWDHPIRYIPYGKDEGYGTVISLGEDGKEGGTGMNADLECLFPPQGRQGREPLP